MKAIKFFAIAILFSGVSVMASAQLNNITSSSATASSSATIIKPIKIVKDLDLTFGTIATSSAAGTVTIAADAVANPTAADGVALAPTTGTRQAAKFTISGENNVNYGVTMPATATLTRDGGSETMTVTLSKNLETKGNTLGASDATLYVGGVLAVSANQVSGVYNGEFAVTVQYE